jgi:hypothetical protein
MRAKADMDYPQAKSRRGLVPSPASPHAIQRLAPDEDTATRLIYPALPQGHGAREKGTAGPPSLDGYGPMSLDSASPAQSDNSGFSFSGRARLCRSAPAGLWLSATPAIPPTNERGFLHRWHDRDNPSLWAAGSVFLDGPDDAEKS